MTVLSDYYILQYFVVRINVTMVILSINANVMNNIIIHVDRIDKHDMYMHFTYDVCSVTCL